MKKTLFVSLLTMLFLALGSFNYELKAEEQSKLQKLMGTGEELMQKSVSSVAENQAAQQAGNMADAQNGNKEMPTEGDAFLNFMANFDFKSDSTEYDAATNTTVVKNFQFSGMKENTKYNGSIASITLVGYDPSKPLNDGHVFDEVKIENFAFDVAKPDSTAENFKINSIMGKSVTYDLKKILSSLTSSDKSGYDFLQTTHNGIELNGITMFDGKKLTVEIAKTSFAPYSSPDQFTMNIDGLKIADTNENAPITLSIQQINFDKLNLMFFNKIVDLMKHNTNPEQIQAEISAMMPNPFEKTLLDLISFKNIEILTSAGPMVMMQDQKISIDEVKLTNAVADNSKGMYTFVLDNIGFSSEIFNLVDPSLLQILGPKLPKRINADFIVNSNIDNNTKTFNYEVISDIEQVVNLAIATNLVYECENPWDVIFFTPKGQESLGFKGINAKLTDSGMASIVATLATTMLGMPPEALGQLAIGSIPSMIESISTGVAKIDSALAELGDSLIKFIEKPGALAISVIFDSPVFITRMEGLPENFTYDFEVTQGSKTLQELAM